MTFPKISIVTPVFNSGAYIEKTIESVLGQNYPNFEHIIQDGGSTDNTLDICKKYPHLIVVSEHDKGQSDAINKGFALATGDILAWQNADDYYLDGAFEQAVKHLVIQKKADIVYGNYQMVDSDGKLLTEVVAQPFNFKLFRLGRFNFVQPSVFWTREFHQAGFPLDLSLHYCMDAEFYAKGINKGYKAFCINHFMGAFRVHQESKTQNIANLKKVKAEYYKVLSTNYSYTILDKLWFQFFWNRSQLTSFIKLKILRKNR